MEKLWNKMHGKYFLIKTVLYIMKKLIFLEKKLNIEIVLSLCYKASHFSENLVKVPALNQFFGRWQSKKKFIRQQSIAIENAIDAIDKEKKVVQFFVTRMKENTWNSGEKNGNDKRACKYVEMSNVAEHQNFWEYH